MALEPKSLKLSLTKSNHFIDTSTQDRPWILSETYLKNMMGRCYELENTL